MTAKHTAGRTAFAGALALLFAACGGGSAPVEVAPRGQDALDQAAATITAEDMYERVAYLASDEMRGRDTPSPGLDSAAAYIVREFRRFGLEGGAEGGAFIQRYPFPLIGLDTDGVTLDLSNTGGAELVYGTDFLVLAGEGREAEAPLLWAGPAAAFADVDHEPNTMADVMPVVFLPGAAIDQPWQRALNAARTAAADAGAPALVYVLDPAFAQDQLARLRGFIEPARRTLGGEVTGLTRVFLTYDAAQSVLAAAGMELDALRAAADAATNPVPVTGVTASLGAPVRVYEDAMAPNVVGVLRGSDPALANTYVVFSAHMDHVGVGEPDATGDSIYNGADDDASGTSALIEVAEAFSTLLQRPKRSLIFLAVSGEEKGLLGSRWYSDHPTVPMDSIVANINVDMIARNSPDSVVVIGQEYSSLGPLVQRVGAAEPELGLTVSEDIWPEERFFFRSDHFNFARKEVPALFFFTGVHEDYHRPSDEVDTIDTDKAARVARLIFHTAHAIADDATRPSWTEQGITEIRRLTGGGR